MFASKNIEITDNMAEEITNLALKIRALPVSYMEAKPHRIVDFSEAAAVIIPRGLSIENDIIKMAERNNLKIYKYEEEKERQAAILKCTEDPAVVLKSF